MDKVKDIGEEVSHLTILEKSGLTEEEYKILVERVRMNCEVREAKKLRERYGTLFDEIMDEFDSTFDIVFSEMLTDLDVQVINGKRKMVMSERTYDSVSYSMVDATSDMYFAACVVGQYTFGVYLENYLANNRSFSKNKTILGIHFNNK